MRRINRIIPVLIVMILIVLIGSKTVKEMVGGYKAGTKDFVDYEKNYGLNADEYSITLNNAVQNFKGITSDGHIYIDTENVAKYINSRFYWDSNELVFIYTKATEIIKAYPGEEKYYIDGAPVSMDHAPVKKINDTVYVSAEYIQKFTQCELEIYNEPNRIVVTTTWGEQPVATVEDETAMRLLGGPRSEILRYLEADEEVVVLQMEDDWSWCNVATKDGYVGWMEKEHLGKQTTKTTKAPAFEEDEFTYIKEDGRICLAWHQVTNYDASSVGSLKQALNNTQGITIISPTWFYMSDTEGNLGSIANYDYIAYAHEVGLKVWAVFQNVLQPGGTPNGNQTDKVLSYTSKREKLVSQVVEQVLTLGIDGINLDFEMILEDAGDNYIQFVRELSVACRENGICFSIDNYVPLYTRHYNRAEQAVFADYLVIMGYDEHGKFSTEAGPVASIPFVREGIEETLEIIGGDSSKVINGIPFYVGLWETGPNNYLHYDDVVMSDAASYLLKYPDKTERYYDEELGYNYGQYTSPINDLTYKIWLEDATSVEQKMKLIQEYDLAGVACWKLQQETADVWPIISSYLNY